MKQQTHLLPPILPWQLQSFHPTTIVKLPLKSTGQQSGGFLPFAHLSSRKINMELARLLSTKLRHSRVWMGSMIIPDLEILLGPL
jgi:hypothetical protein